MNNLLKEWVGKNLPEEHLFLSSASTDKVTSNPVREFSTKLIYHPLKRHLSRTWLGILKKFFGVKVIVITGSAGKTSTKDLITAVLSKKYNVVSSYQNVDPVYNIPSTILRATPRTDFIVLEMGIEYKGEMDFYLWLASPDIGVFTSLYYTHTENLGSLKDVKIEKSKMVKAVPQEGLVFLSADDPNVMNVRGALKAPVVTYGFSEGSEVKGENLRITDDLKTEFEFSYLGRRDLFKLNLLGEQYAVNALAAAAIGVKSDVDSLEIKKALESFSPVMHRLVPLSGINGSLIIDDTYNSNPLAVRKALKLLSQIPKLKTIAVLADMKELGSFNEGGHREVGEEADSLGINKIYGYGEEIKYTLESFSGSKKHFETKEDISEQLKRELDSDTAVLVKGSRSMRMEEVVEGISAKYE